MNGILSQPRRVQQGGRTEGYMKPIPGVAYRRNHEQESAVSTECIVRRTGRGECRNNVKM